MHLNDETEILIERCVDDELNAADTRSLMMDMDSIPDGWKTLACRFLEERTLQRHVAEMVTAPRAGESDEGTAAAGVLTSSGSAAAVKGSRHWFGHPVVSLSLCAAIAFVSGLLIPKWNDGMSAGQPGPVVAQRNPAVVNPRQSPVGSVAADAIGARAVPRYTLEWTPSSGHRVAPVEIPVYQDVDDWAQEVAGSRQDAHSRRGGIFSSDGQDATRVIRLPVSDSEDILLFVQEQDFDLPLQ